VSVVELGADPFDLDRIEGIAARLDLRQPNREALESIVFEVARHYEIDREPPPFEAVVDLATGVGKTYVLAAAIEYLAADGVRNFAVITPGRTILDKTVDNFTPGHRKSLLGGMEVRPVVITSENFATPAMRADMEDPEQVKLFIFTVQALLKPETKMGRKTHKFQEGLGEAFYAHLQALDDLVVFADEHHTYYGPGFSTAIRELRPRVLIGLTATPDKRTPPSQIIHRYPLAAAIADRLVKTPVLVGRRDDRMDPATKLLDGVRLLELKERAIARWCQATGAEPVVPMMLVIAPDINEANEIEGIVRDPSFAGGRYADAVLTVHSKVPDEALAQLDRLEDPGSPYRIVISVGMLKEGWDVKNVYVIASMRASVSDILTEQTLGRGLRLPFGRYTDVEILDTLEVLGHERYEDLLRKAGVLNEQFIDRRTLTERVLMAPVVPARSNQRYAAGEIVDAFLRGLGPSAEKILSGYMDRAAAGLIQLVTEEHRKVASKPTYGEVVELVTFDKVRTGRPTTTSDRYGDFKGKKGVGFDGYRKSRYAQDWFDSSTERDAANILEDAPDITGWVRLQIGDLPILWTEAREYNPDFIAIDREDTHWVVEVKMDKEMQSAEVQRKRDAARRWANYVSGDEKVGACWRYLLVSETDVKNAKGAWEALKGLGGA